MNTSTHGEMIRAVQDGVEILIKAQPGSKRSGPLALSNGRIRWGINTPPLDGKANKALIKNISQYFKIPQSSIEIVRGELSREKTICMFGTTLEKVKETLSQDLSLLEM